MKTTELSRIHWACRRGMLELDMLLVHYFTHYYEKLSEKEKQDFIDLLSSADQDLYNWLMEEAEPDNPLFKQLCHTIRQAYHA